MPAGGKLAAGKLVVTEDDFIVDDDDSGEDYETASSTGGEGQGSEGGAPSPGAELEEDWVDWADGEDVDEKLRSVVNGKGTLLAGGGRYSGGDERLRDGWSLLGIAC